MDDLISRQAAIDEAYAVIVDDAVFDVVQVETLEGLPTIDAVEVVRCKDCIIHGLCRFEQGLGLDGFCSKGERKDDCSKGRRNDGTDKSRRV